MSVSIDNYLSQHGLENVELDDPRVSDLREHEDVTFGWITFDNTVKHVGALLGGHAFNLNHVSIRYPDKLNNETKFEAQPNGFDIVQTTRENPVILDISVESRRVENWAVWLTNDSPPYAINRADALQVGVTQDDFEARNLIREGFGEDAVPILSIDEAKLLITAVANTEARPTGIYE